MLIGDGVDARQRGPRLRAAPDPAPRDPLDAAARLRGPGAARAAAGRARLHGAVLPRARRRDFERISTYAYAEEDAFRQTLRAGTTILDIAVAEPSRPAARQLSGRQGLPAARHVRLPDRPDPGDGGRAGHRGRRGRVPPADGRAARAGQGRRAGEEDRRTPTCRVYRGALDTGRRRVHRLPRDGARGDGHRAHRRGRPAAGRRARATRSRSSSTSTPFYAEGGGQQPDWGRHHGQRRRPRGRAGRRRRAAAAARA